MRVTVTVRIHIVLGIRPTVDFAFKRIFGSPENVVSLIGLLNAILQFDPPIAAVTILNPFNYKDFEGDKLIVLDVLAKDSRGCTFNIEMQMAPHRALLQRLAFYASQLYLDQLKESDRYVELRPAITICLLSNVMFADSPQAHHRFQLLDRESGRSIGNSIEVHTVELSKYSLDEAALGSADSIEKWAFFLLRAQEFEAAPLRQLLPGIEYQHAIASVETIAGKTEDKVMYDQRERAKLNYEWMLADARQDGVEEGIAVGEAKGKAEGEAKGKAEGEAKGKAEGEAKGKAEGEAKGKAEGEAKGKVEGLSQGLLIGQLQLLQSLNHEPVTDQVKLLLLSNADLAKLVEQFQDRLRQRIG